MLKHMHFLYVFLQFLVILVMFFTKVNTEFRRGLERLNEYGSETNLGRFLTGGGNSPLTNFIHNLTLLLAGAKIFSLWRGASEPRPSYLESNSLERQAVNASVCKKKSIFSQNMTFGDLWCPQYRPNLKMMCIKI